MHPKAQTGREGKRNSQGVTATALILNLKICAGSISGNAKSAF